MSEIACFLWRHLSTTDVGQHLFPHVPPPPRLAPSLSRRETLHLFLEEQSKGDETKRSKTNRCCCDCPSPSELTDGSQALMQFIKILCLIVWSLQAMSVLESICIFSLYFNSLVFYVSQWCVLKITFVFRIFIYLVFFFIFIIIVISIVFIWPSPKPVHRNY